ncbi:hypothetical protein [Sinorhizobium medicae]
MTDRPAIKPLEWIEHGDQDFVWHRATPPIGFRYNIEDDGFSEKKHHLTVGQLVIGNFDTLYEAKAAAQQDYERRIRSCLLDKPEAVEGGAEYGKGLRDGVREAIQIASEQAALMADLAIEGLPENSGTRQAMEAALTRFATTLRDTLSALSPSDTAPTSTDRPEFWEQNCQYLLDIFDNHGFMASDLAEEDEDLIAEIRAHLKVNFNG